MGTLYTTHSHQQSPTWNLERPWNRISSTFRDRPWPGHIVLSSVNQPSFATPMPSAAVPGWAFSLAAIDVADELPSLQQGRLKRR